MEIRSDDGRKIIGHVEGRVFKKNVQGSIHQLREPPSWGIDEGAVTKIARAGVTSIQIHDTEKDIYYSVELATFQANCFVVERGFNRQLALVLNRWRTDTTPSLQPILPFIPEAQPQNGKRENGQQCLTCAHMFCAMTEDYRFLNQPLPDPCPDYHVHP